MLVISGDVGGQTLLLTGGSAAFVSDRAIRRRDLRLGLGLAAGGVSLFSGQPRARRGLRHGTEAGQSCLQFDRPRRRREMMVFDGAAIDRLELTQQDVEVA